jgi:hypothetical protein
MEPERIAERAAAGMTHGDERAYVRLGVNNTLVITGQDDLSQWDDEELRRGRKRDKHGGWMGKDPVVVPKVLHDELVKRTISKANSTMLENLNIAVEMLTSIVSGTDVEPKDKLTAIRMIMDRVMGKEPQKIEVGGEAKWQVAIQAGIVSLPADGIVSDALGGVPSHVIDVESTEEDMDGNEED